MPTTPLGFPYSLLTDAPNGPSQEQTLAAAVDAFLTTTPVVTRTGGRATTAATQSVTINTITALNNGGGAWSATEDSGGFVSATAGTTAPLVVPADKGGLYIVGFNVVIAAIIGSRAFCDIRINGTGNTRRAVFTGDALCGLSLPVSLAAGDTVGAQVFLNPAGTVSIGSEIFCYRIGA